LVSFSLIRLKAEKETIYMKYAIMSWNQVLWLNGVTIGLELLAIVERMKKHLQDFSHKLEDSTMCIISGVRTRSYKHLKSFVFSHIEEFPFFKSLFGLAIAQGNTWSCMEKAWMGWMCSLYCPFNSANAYQDYGSPSVFSHSMKYDSEICCYDLE